MIILIHKLIFLAVTWAVVFVAVISMATDASSQTRLFWIGLAVCSLGVVTTWKFVFPPKSKNKKGEISEYETNI